MTHLLKSYTSQANVVFPDSFIEQAFQLGPSDARPVELSARYLVAEVCDLYSAESNDQANLTRMIANLDVAAAHLADVAACFRELRSVAEGAEA